MNLKKLRDEICGEIELTKGQEKMLFEIFETFQQSNKSEATETKEATDFKRMLWLCKEDIASMCREEIQGMKKEIEALKKQNDILFKFVPHELKKEEPKKERFTVEMFEPARYKDYGYYIKDGVYKFSHEGLCNKSFANDLCAYLNSLEASKNE